MNWFEGKHTLDPVRQPVIVLGPIYGLGSLGSGKGGAWWIGWRFKSGENLWEAQ